MNHATLADLAGMAGALLLWPVVLVIPGMAIGWLTNVLAFRERSLWEQVAMGNLLGISLVPILSYWLTRVAGWTALWVALAIAAGVLCHALFRGGLGKGPSALASLRTRQARRIALGLGIFALLCAVMLVDVQIGSGLYRSLMTFDYVKHVAVTSSISRTGVPPLNPSFFDGEPLSLYYYYFHFLLSSAVDQLGGPLIDAPAAVHAGTIWVGWGLVSVTWLYVSEWRKDLLGGLSPSCAVWAPLLLLVTGLDLLPVVFLGLAKTAFGRPGAWELTIEWWNEQISAWLDAVLWVPHHVAGLVGCLMAFLFVDRIVQSTTRGQKAILSVAAGLSLASALGSSVWVTLVASMIAAVWVLVSAVRREGRELAAWLVVGVVAGLAALPYLCDLHRANHLAGFPLAFTVRRFYFADHLTLFSGLDDHLGLWATRLVLLPVNYALELGFFGLTSAIYWTHRVRQGGSLTRRERFLLVVGATSLLACTFLRSTIANNDLGWRGFLFAQFAMLMWSVPVVASAFGLAGGAGRRTVEVGTTTRRLLAATMLLGVLAIGYDLVSMRLRCRGDIGEAALALRRTYEWIDRTMPADAVLAHNPDVPVEYFHALYGHRQVVLSDEHYGALYGISTPMVARVDRVVSRIFAEDASLDEVRNACATLGVDALVVKSTDPVWSGQHGWVHGCTAVFENEFAKVVRVSDLSPAVPAAPRTARQETTTAANRGS